MKKILSVMLGLSLLIPTLAFAQANVTIMGWYYAGAQRISLASDINGNLAVKEATPLSALQAQNGSGNIQNTVIESHGFRTLTVPLDYGVQWGSVTVQVATAAADSDSSAAWVVAYGKQNKVAADGLDFVIPSQYTGVEIAGWICQSKANWGGVFLSSLPVNNRAPVIGLAGTAAAHTNQWSFAINQVHARAAWLQLYVYNPTTQSHTYSVAVYQHGN